MDNTFISTNITLPDDDTTDETGRKRPAQPGSFIAVLEALEVGDTATRCKEVTHVLQSPLGASEETAEERRRFHNSLNSQVRKLEGRSGRGFKIEMTEVFMASSARLFIVAFVTRIA